MSNTTTPPTGKGFSPRGVITAIATPLLDSGELDVNALARHTEQLLQAGVDGILACGTTGEGALLSPEEKQQITETIQGIAGTRVPVMGAVIQPDTRTAVNELRRYANLSVAAVAVVSPYYVRVDEGELIAHFRTVADASRVPVVVYDIPGNTANPLTEAVFDAVLDHPNIVGVKDSSGNFSRFSRLVLDARHSISWIQGEDTLDGPSVLLGAGGIVSGLSNILPQAFVRMWAAGQTGDQDTVLAMQTAVNRIHAIVRATGKGVAAIRLALSLDGTGSRFLHSPSLSLDADWDQVIGGHVAAARKLLAQS